jgi:hypothetical protein
MNASVLLQIVRCDAMSAVKWLPTFRGVTVPSTSLSGCQIRPSNIVRPNYLQEFKCLYVALCLWTCSSGRIALGVSENICVFFRVPRLFDPEDKANPSYETSGPASPPTGCHIPSAVRTSNLTTLRLAKCNIPEEENLRERL